MGIKGQKGDGSGGRGHAALWYTISSMSVIALTTAVVLLHSTGFLLLLAEEN